jgi:hypothetical protein
MYAKIIQDHLDVTEDLGEEYQREGKVIIGSEEQIEGPILDVRVLDDDRVPYYTLKVDDQSLEAVFAWCQQDTGSTILQVKDHEDKEWRDVIS